MTNGFRSIPDLPIIAAALFIGTPLLVVVLAVIRRRHGENPSSSWTTSLGDGLLAAVTLGVLWLLLFPSAGLAGHHYFDAHPFRTLWDEITHSPDAEQALTQIGGNILIFAPLGLLVPLRWPRLDSFGRLLIAAGLTAALIEGLQYAIGGRISSISDWLLNITGALLGYGALRFWRQVRRRPGRPGE